MKIFISTLIIFSLLSLSSFAAGLSSEQQTKSHTEMIMKSIIDYKLQDTKKLINTYSKISKNQVNSIIDKISFQRKQIGITSGYSSEFVSTKKVGNSLIRYIYLEKTETVPLVWYFYYYKDKGGWSLFKFEYNEEQELLFN